MDFGGDGHLQFGGQWVNPNYPNLQLKEWNYLDPKKMKEKAAEKERAAREKEKIELDIEAQDRKDRILPSLTPPCSQPKEQVSCMSYFFVFFSHSFSLIQQAEHEKMFQYLVENHKQWLLDQVHFLVRFFFLFFLIFF